MKTSWIFFTVGQDGSLTRTIARESRWSEDWEPIQEFGSEFSAMNWLKGNSNDEAGILRQGDEIVLQKVFIVS